MKALVLPAMLVLTAPALVQEKNTADEYDIKAAYIYNFAKFIEWPRESRPAEGRPFKVGIFGKDPSQGRIQASLVGKSANGAGIVVQSFSDVGQAGNYHVVFIPSLEKESEDSLFKQLSGMPVLALGEREGFIQAGGLINFYMEDNKIRIELEHESVIKAGLTVSSKLLRVMRIVKR